MSLLIKLSLISDPYSMEFQDWLLVFGTSVASIIATLLVIPASRMATPTIVNMVRSTELLFAYAVEFALYGTVPEPLVAAGAALVLASITAMTLADKIQARLDKLFRLSSSSSSSLEKSEELDRDQGDVAMRSSLLVCDRPTELNESTCPRLRDPASDRGGELTQHRALFFAEVCSNRDAQKGCTEGA